MPDPAPTRETSEDYLEYLRGQRCVICLAPNGEPHHLDSRGSGGSDFAACTTCRDCHRLIHQKGLAFVEEKYKVNVWRQAHRQLRRYHSDHTNPAR